MVLQDKERQARLVRLEQRVRRGRKELRGHRGLPVGPEELARRERLERQVSRDRQDILDILEELDQQVQ